MTNEALHELAARVEAAEAGETDLDKAIAEALGWRLVVLQHDDGVSDYDWKSPSGEVHPWYPFFTRSIDAALTLVPEGAFYGFVMSGEGDGFCACCQFAGPDEEPPELLWHTAATPALALTAAALRALATKDPTP